MQTRSTESNSHVISYELKRLNKMIVAEQMFSEIYTHSNKRFLPGLERFWSFDKKVLLSVNARVQATYDLNEMDIRVDSVKKVIYIDKIPPLEVKIFPDVQFYDMDQSVFNRFEKDELNEVKAKAIEHIEEKIDRKELEAEAREQLIENLGTLYLLAHAYGWKIKDSSSLASELQSKFH